MTTAYLEVVLRGDRIRVIQSRSDIALVYQRVMAAYDNPNSAKNTFNFIRQHVDERFHPHIRRTCGRAKSPTCRPS